LLAAAAAGDIRMTEMLLKRGANVNAEVPAEALAI
jgi:hypothetical protein